MVFVKQIVLLFLSALAVLSAAADIGQVRIVGNGAPTRITIWSDTAQDARAFLAESEAGRSLIVPLAGEFTPRAGDGTGGVTSWALVDGRISFALDRPLMVSRVLTLPPAGRERSHRVIVDLQAVSVARFTSVAKRDMRNLATAEANLRKAEIRREIAAMAPAVPLKPAQRVGNGKYIIVVDAGHGGKDPGAIAVTGAREKDIALRAAKKLKKLLRKDPRYDVRLTRETDVFLELEERVTLAREWGADLFISIHADAAKSSDVEGASIYTISERGERRIDKEANRNNWRIPLEDGTPQQVSGILEDLVKRETKTRSAEFAEMLLPELDRAGPVLRRTHRNAGFYVLLAPDVPAVLLEMGFLTNRKDALRLQSNAGLDRSMKAVKRGIDRFFDQQEILLAEQG